MLLLEKKITKNKRVAENITELNASNSKKYEVEAIWHSAVYAIVLEGYLLRLYYLIVWKGYSKKVNT